MRPGVLRCYSRAMAGQRVALLSMDDLTGFVCDDDLAIPHLAARGVEVDWVSWRAEADWGAYDAVVIRTPWDYQDHLPAFLAVLERIEQATLLLNPLSTVRWNTHKSYLFDLEARGVRIVPTVATTGFDPAALPGWRAHFGAERLIVKPTVAANADGALPLPPDIAPTALAEYADAHRDEDLLVQPMLSSVVDWGEASLFYFNGIYSHAILKVPEAGDFRVQEEHGGDIQPLVPTEDLRAAARTVLEAVAEPLLYARVDLARDADGQPCLMEVELAEPALYLRTDAGAPERFAEAVIARLGTPGGG